MQALANQAGRSEEVVAILKGIRPEMLNFDLAEMPLASAPQAFSYEDLEPRGTNPYARGLIEAMLEMPDTAPPAAQPKR